MSCIPKTTKTKDLSLARMMEERKLWAPIANYGNDDVHCISPPLVSEESKNTYDNCASSCKQGTYTVPEVDQFVYEQFNQSCILSS